LSCLKLRDQHKPKHPTSKDYPYIIVLPFLKALLPYNQQETERKPWKNDFTSTPLPPPKKSHKKPKKIKEEFQRDMA